MRRILGAAALLGALALVAACDGDDRNEETGATETAVTPATQATRSTTPGGTPTATPSPTPSDASSVSSGVQLIDDIVRAVKQRDAAALEAHLHYFLIACTEPQGIGAIPCPPGQPPGTAVQAIGSGTCEGAFVLQGDPTAAMLVANFLATEPELYAVAVRPRAGRDELIPGDYLAIFRKRAGPFPGSGSALTIDQDGVTWLGFGCGAGTVEDVLPDRREYLIPPR